MSYPSAPPPYDDKNPSTPRSLGATRSPEPIPGATLNLHPIPGATRSPEGILGATHSQEDIPTQVSRYPPCQHSR